jgi:predicted transcriptional regulator
MRPRVEWMTSADNRILEFLRDKEIVASPRVISVNIDYDRQYVSKRLRILAQNDLVDNIDTGLYQITDRGRLYLDGELEKDDLTPGQHGE